MPRALDLGIRIVLAAETMTGRDGITAYALAPSGCSTPCVSWIPQN